MSDNDSYPAQSHGDYRCRYCLTALVTGHDFCHEGCRNALAMQVVVEAAEAMVDHEGWRPGTWRTKEQERMRSAVDAYRKAIHD